MLQLLVVSAAGGLGSCVVREALSRGHAVSVLVRSQEKLAAALGGEVVSRLAAVHVGDATDAAVVAKAAQGVNAVIATAVPQADIARTVAEQAKAAGAKLVWTAGASNLPEADGRLHYLAFGAAGEGYYKAHTPCIDAVKATGVTYIIWCPGLMKARGAKSVPQPPTLLQADPSGLAQYDFVSYEDAAQVIVSAVETNEFDNKHISALSPPA